MKSWVGGIRKDCILLSLFVFFINGFLFAEAFKSITVVSDDNYPPYIFKDQNGKLQGILVDQWKLWEEKTGIKVTLKAMDWNEAQKIMQQGEADVIDTMFYTPERALTYDFSKPYAQLPVTVFFNKKIQGISDLNSLQGFTIGVKSGDACIEELKKHGITTLQKFNNYENIVKAATENKLHVFCVDESPALYFLYKMKAEDDFRSSLSLYAGEFHRAVKKGRGDLLVLLENGFSRITPEEYTRIQNKWLGISINKPAYYHYLPPIFAGTGVVFFLMMMGNIFLNRKVKSKTLELKQALAILQESEEKYRKFIFNSLDGILLADDKGDLIEYNKALESITGIPAEKVLHRPLWELMTKEGNESFRGSLKNYFETGESTWVGKALDHEITDVNGKKKNLQIIFFPIVIHRGFFLGGVLRDITERKKVEAELFSSQALYSKIFNNFPDPIFLVDVLPEDHFRVVATNPAQMKLLGVPPEKHWGKLIEEFLPAEFAQEVNRNYKECVRLNQDIVYEEEVGPPVNKCFQTKLALIRDQSEKVVQIIGTTRDITERRNMEDSLKKSEAKNKALLTTNPDMMFILSKDGVFLDYKVDDVKNLYRGPEQFIGKKISEILPPEVAESTLTSIRKLMETGENQAYDYSLKIGNKVEFFDARMVLYGSDEILVIVRNMTSKKKLEEERQKANKLESIGILAGGIAHDFNNILAAIVGNISLANLELSSGGNPSELLLEAEKAGFRARNLTAQLLTFSRGGDPVKENANVNDIIKDSTDFILRGSKVIPEFFLASDLLISMVDKGQISQVIQNLILNANQAMPEGGKIEVFSSNTDLPENNVYGLKPGSYISISIKDQGIGIEEKNFKNIFDPYFTTKKQGSGLGLAVCYSIIQKHGGTIDVKSVIGKGSVFTILLPVIRGTGTLEEKADNAAPVGAKIRNKINILFMDDESALRNLAKSIFKGFGYDYELASDGNEAILLFQKALKENHPFDLVIMDLTIPGGMGGKEAIQNLLLIDPGVKAIVTSGYSNDAAISDYQEYGFKGRIVKPFSVKDVIEEINRVSKNG